MLHSRGMSLSVFELASRNLNLHQMFASNFGTTADMIVIIISLEILSGLKFRLLHHSRLCGLITQSIINCKQRNGETWSDRSPSPDGPLCVGDSCESSPSLRRSHIPVIVHSPTGRLCSSATSHHAQPRRAASAHPWGRRHRPGRSLRRRRGPSTALPQTLPAPPDVFWFWQERGRRRRRRGLFPWHSGGCLLGSRSVDQ